MPASKTSTDPVPITPDDWYVELQNLPPRPLVIAALLASATNNTKDARLDPDLVPPTADTRNRNFQNAWIHHIGSLTPVQRQEAQWTLSDLHQRSAQKTIPLILSLLTGVLLQQTVHAFSFSKLAFLCASVTALILHSVTLWHRMQRFEACGALLGAPERFPIMFRSDL